MRSPTIITTLYRKTLKSNIERILEDKNIPNGKKASAISEMIFDQLSATIQGHHDNQIRVRTEKIMIYNRGKRDAQRTESKDKR